MSDESGAGESVAIVPAAKRARASPSGSEAIQAGTICTVSGQRVFSRDMNIVVECENEEDARILANDAIAQNMIQATADKATLATCAKKILSNLSAEGRSKTIGECMKDSLISEDMFKQLEKDFSMKTTSPIGDLLHKMVVNSAHEMTQLSHLRGIAASAFESMTDSAEFVQDVMNGVGQLMGDADSEAEDNVWKSEKMNKKKRSVEMEVTKHGKDLGKAIEDMPVDAPSSINALMAIHQSTVDMPENANEQVMSFRKKEQKLISDRMVIADATEELDQIKTQVTFAERELEDADQILADKSMLLAADTSRLEGEMAVVKESIFESGPQPASIQDLVDGLKCRQDEILGRLKDVEKRQPKEFVPPVKRDPDLSAVDAAMKEATKKLGDMMANPETTRVSTRKHTFLGLWSWESEVKSSHDDDAARQKTKLDSLKHGMDAAKAAKASAVQAHNEQEQVFLDLAKNKHKASVDEFKALKKDFKSELGDVKAELEDVKKRGEAALSEFHQKEEKRREEFENKKSEKILAKTKLLNEAIHSKKAMLAETAKQKCQIETIIDKAPEQLKARQEKICLLETIWKTDAANLLLTKNRIQTALTACGGSETAMYNVLDNMQKAHAALLNNGLAMAGMKPILRQPLAITEAFTEDMKCDYDLWKAELKKRMKLFNKYSTQGLALLSPSKVQIRVLPEPTTEITGSMAIKDS